MRSLLVITREFVGGCGQLELLSLSRDGCQSVTGAMIRELRAVQSPRIANAFRVQFRLQGNLSVFALPQVVRKRAGKNSCPIGELHDIPVCVP